MFSYISTDPEKYITKVFTYPANPHSGIFVFYQDGRTKEIPNSEISEFIQISENSKIITKELAHHIKNDYPHLFASPPAHEHLLFLYDQLRTLILQELEIAKKEEKKLLIVAGEEHTNKGSLLLQIMMLYILHEANINNLLVEASPDLLYNLIYSSRNFKAVIAEHSVPLASNELKMNLIHADLDLQKEVTLEEREKYMIDQCLKTNNDCCFITGAAHLKGMLTNKLLKDKYHTLGLNIRCITPEQLNLQVSKAKTMQMKEELLFPSTKEVMQIELKGNASVLKPEEIISIVRQIHYLKIGKEDPRLAELNERLQKCPKNVAHRLARANIYFSQKNYLKALEDYQSVYKDYPLNRTAAQGIENCQQLLKQDTTIPQKKLISPTLSKDSFIVSTLIPPQLQEALNSGGVKEYIKKGHTTLEQLIELQETKPWIISALRCKNICEGIFNRNINIKQLTDLTEEQVLSIRHNIYNKDLQSKVKGYIEQNEQGKSRGLHYEPYIDDPD